MHTTSLRRAHRHARRLAGALLVAAGLWTAAQAATTPPQAPVLPNSGELPALAPGWAERNPLRGQPAAIALGRSAFNQSCAACHGTDADGSRAPAPDLRRMGRGCARVQDPALRQRCDADADHFFLKSVLKGKQKFGIEHMPAWEGVLEPAVVWSIRSFLQSGGAPAPR